MLLLLALVLLGALGIARAARGGAGESIAALLFTAAMCATLFATGRF